MTVWRKTVDVSDVFHNDDLTISQKAIEIVNRFMKVIGPDQGDDSIYETLDELAEVGEDERYFNICWTAVYDWADDNRVWIDTIGKGLHPVTE